MASSEDIKNVLSGLLAGIDNDNKESFETVSALPGIQKACGAVRGKNCEGFYYALIYPLSKMVDGLLAQELPSSREARFLFKHSRFVESQFRRLIEKHEGSACCADKTRTIMRGLVVFMTTGVEIAFDYSHKYTFHLPTRVFTTHAEIAGFFDAVYRMYHGHPEPLFEALQRIQARLAEPEKGLANTQASPDKREATD